MNTIAKGFKMNELEMTAFDIINESSEMETTFITTADVNVEEILKDVSNTTDIVTAFDMIGDFLDSNNIPYFLVQQLVEERMGTTEIDGEIFKLVRTKVRVIPQCLDIHQDIDMTQQEINSTIKTIISLKGDDSHLQDTCFGDEGILVYNS